MLIHLNIPVDFSIALSKDRGDPGHREVRRFKAILYSLRVILRYIKNYQMGNIHTTYLPHNCCKEKKKGSNHGGRHDPCMRRERSLSDDQ